MSEEPKLPKFAKSTDEGENEFKIKVGFKIGFDRVLRPCSWREAEFKGIITAEYPSYEEELQARKENTQFDDVNMMTFLDQDGILEWRLRRCLKSWNFHTLIPNFTKELVKVERKLSDDSLNAFKKLPPRLRKEIVRKLWNALGPA